MVISPLTGCVWPKSVRVSSSEILPRLWSKSCEKVCQQNLLWVKTFMAGGWRMVLTIPFLTSCFCVSDKDKKFLAANNSKSRGILALPTCTRHYRRYNSLALTLHNLKCDFLSMFLLHNQPREDSLSLVFLWLRKSWVNRLCVPTKGMAEEAIQRQDFDHYSAGGEALRMAATTGTHTKE